MHSKKDVIYYSSLFFSVVVFFWITGACSSLKASHKGQTKSMPISIQIFDNGNTSFQKDSKTHFKVYTDADVFLSAYTQIHAGMLPQPEAPIIDFEKWTVIGAFLGQRPSAGYGIELGSAKTFFEDGSKILELTVRVQEPPANMMQAQVVTSPYTLIKVPKTQWKSIRFLDTTGALLREVPIIPQEGKT